MNTQAVELPRSRSKPLYHHLYFWVLVGIGVGILIGLTAPEVGAKMRWMATLFINLVKMVIAPTIFATVAVGIAGIGSLTKAGGLALRTVIYFNVTTVFALAIGLVLVNVLQPGAGLNLDVETFDGTLAAGTLEKASAAADSSGFIPFLMDLVPGSFAGAFVGGNLIQVLLLSILVACSISMMGERGKPAIVALDVMAQVMFGVIKLVMWVAPLGAMGGIAFTIGKYGGSVLGSLLQFMLGFYATCLIFIFGVLGVVCWMCKFSVFKYIRLIKDELLIVLGTSSSETVLPRMLSKLEAAGAQRSVVGLVIPTGYSFNLDGTAIYMVMGAIFIAQAFGIDVPIGTQIAILAFILVSSNGAAGVSGSGLIILAASLTAFSDIIPVVGIALIVGIDRFMSEARALTNLAGNGIGTLAIAHWTGALDRERLNQALNDPNSIDVDELMSQRNLAH